MAGPHPPNPAVGADGPHQPQPFPAAPAQGPHEPETLDFPPDLSGAGQPLPPTGEGAAVPAPYPPAAAGPKRSRKRVLIGTLLVIALVAALTAAIVYGVRTNGASTGGNVSETAAKTAVQNYLTALTNKDIDTIVRNALCGIYDGVKDKRSDQALARLSSDAFRKQFSQVEVTSIDKIVYLSQYQAQVLFTMQVTPATGGPPRNQVQGVAQLLFQRGQIMVCSYVLRTAGQF